MKLKKIILTIPFLAVFSCVGCKGSQDPVEPTSEYDSFTCKFADGVNPIIGDPLVSRDFVVSAINTKDSKKIKLLNNNEWHADEFGNLGYIICKAHNTITIKSDFVPNVSYPFNFDGINV